MSKNQFGFTIGRSTIEAIHLIRQVIEYYRARERGFRKIFIYSKNLLEGTSKSTLLDIDKEL